MTFGLPLAGSVADSATLAVLVEAAPDLAEGPWSSVQERDGPGSVLASAGIDLTRALRLARRGLDVVALSDEPHGVLLTAVADDRPPLRWPSPHRRDAPHLIEAIRPHRLPGEPLVDEALFLLPAESPAARVLLERLLLLQRGDVQVSSFAAGDREHFAVRVKAPPVYLLMTARDDDAPGVGVYARHAATSLWTAWSYEHPLAGPAAAALARAGHTALVDPRGAWLRLPAEWRARSIYDALTPVFPATPVDLTPTDTDLRFQIQLRLAPGPLADADLWLLTPDQLLDLEPLIEACSADELGRLTVARLTGKDGTVYLLRERVRPGAARMAARVSETLGLPGYVAVAGADNLYVPAGRRLVPLLRRDDLRKLLALDRAHTVVITEDRDGPRVVTILSVEESPLQRWIDYVATDRRLELDRLLERSVFEFPDVTIDWPESPRAAAERPPPREPRRTAPVKLVHPAAPAPTEDAQPLTIDEDHAARLAALRDRARELEKLLLPGGVDDPAPWYDLALIKQQLGDPDEAAACLESALLHGGPPYDPALARLLVVLNNLSLETVTDDQLTEMVVADRRTPAESARLGALVVAHLAAGRPPADEVMQLALPLFADPRLPVARRLAWIVLAAWYHHARDRLGLTRAKESIVGGINDRGLSELHDLPRFVRHALAREGDDEAAQAGQPRGDRLQQGQLVALEALWHDVLATGLPDIDVLAAYTRLTFAVGFARLGARTVAQELVAPLDREMDVHEPPNRALFRLYLARLAHESAGSSHEAWAADVQKLVDAVRDPAHQRAVTWLQRRSMWLRTDAVDEPLVGRPTRFRLPDHVEVENLGEHLAREMAPAAGNFDFLIAEAVDIILRRALASGSDAIVLGVLSCAEPGLQNIQILSHRAEAIGTCIHGAACLGDTAMLGRLLDALVDIARHPQLGSVRELTRAVERGFIALRRFGGLDPARGLLEALAGVQPHTVADRCQLLNTVAKGFVQIGEERAADALIDRVCAQLFEGNLDYVTRAQVGVGVSGALRHWPNVARVERFRKFLAALPVFRDTFTTGRYYETHRILMLEAIVDSLADSRTRHSDRIQGFLDQEEHALRRRIQGDWTNVCGRWTS